MAEPPRNRFKTAEGRFTLHSERTSGLAFNYQRATRLTLATLQGGAEDGAWIVYNAGDLIHIARFDATHRVSRGHRAHEDPRTHVLPPPCGPFCRPMAVVLHGVGKA